MHADHVEVQHPKNGCREQTLLRCAQICECRAVPCSAVQCRAVHEMVIFVHATYQWSGITRPRAAGTVLVRHELRLMWGDASVLMVGCA